MAITELCECHLLSLFPSFSSKLRREELEQLRRELDQLKTRLSESLTHTHTQIPCIHSARLHMSFSTVGLQRKSKNHLAWNICSFFYP